jgi:hypothetical protein
MSKDCYENILCLDGWLPAGHHVERTVGIVHRLITGLWWIACRWWIVGNGRSSASVADGSIGRTNRPVDARAGAEISRRRDSISDQSITGSAFASLGFAVNETRPNMRTP